MFAKLRNVAINFVMSVLLCLSVCLLFHVDRWNNLASNGRILMKFGIRVLLDPF